MQVYIDQESVEFYKDYAARHAMSFAAAVREALRDKQESLRRTPLPKKSTHPIVAAITKAQESLAGLLFHTPNKRDDELLYG